MLYYIIFIIIYICIFIYYYIILHYITLYDVILRMYSMVGIIKHHQISCSPSFSRDHCGLGGLHDQQKGAQSRSWERQAAEWGNIFGKFGNQKTWKTWKTQKLLPKKSHENCILLYFLHFPLWNLQIQEMPYLSGTNSYGSCLPRSMQIWISIARKIHTFEMFPNATCAPTKYVLANRKKLMWFQEIAQTKKRAADKSSSLDSSSGAQKSDTAEEAQNSRRPQTDYKL